MKARNPQQIINLIEVEDPYQSLDSVKISEPRLEMVHNRIRELLKVVKLESDGQPVEVDGFRLRDPGQWTSRCGTPFSDLWGISNACNMRCPFCYEEGDPEGLTVLNEPAAMTTFEEIETRIKHRDSELGTSLFQPLTFTNEIFCNPDAMAIITRLREESPDEVLTFVTNGTYLTEDIVAKLAELKPIFFNFSVNSLDPEIRRKILVDKFPEVAIQTVELLRKYEIPYLGSLVCWPTIPWEDIENTVRVLDEEKCAIIRFSLPAYSKELKGQRFKFDRDEFWAEALEVANRLQQEIDTPLKIEPYHLTDPTTQANIVGVIKGSSAYYAGINSRDTILAVNSVTAHTVNQALSLLAKAVHLSTKVEVLLRDHLTQQERVIELDRDSQKIEFPYSAMRELKGFEWGIILVEGLKFRYLKEMQALIKAHAAKRVLVCSSELMRPIVAEMIAVTSAFEGVDVALEVPPNRFFGGTVSLGDLLVVSDYIEFINEYQANASHPADLVLIPSSPFSRGGWKRDLCGVPFVDIERLTKVPVELIDCKPLDG